MLPAFEESSHHVSFRVDHDFPLPGRQVILRATFSVLDGLRQSGLQGLDATLME